MSRTFRVSVVLAAVTVAVCVVSYVDSAANGLGGTTPSEAASIELKGASDAGSALAARYHLRKRTTRFFNRAATPANYRRPTLKWRSAVDAPEVDQIAARYHLRKRTTRFFDRAIS